MKVVEFGYKTVTLIEEHVNPSQDVVKSKEIFVAVSIAEI
jgi:hypothetical protein